MAKKKAATKTQAPKKTRKSEQPESQSSIIAYAIGDTQLMPIEPAIGTRDWMENTRFRFAYRCLPLVIANQNGWVVQCPYSISMRWTGAPEAEAIKIKGPKGVQTDAHVVSHFGHGVVTFRLPYLFRTPPGINLWVKGPANWIKDGVQPLEGVVETDWLESTFTMNWIFTRKNATVKFAKGDPICMIVPVPRTLTESLVPESVPIAENIELSNTYDIWRKERLKFNEGLVRGDPEFVELGWQKDYMLGRRLDGTKVDSHRTKLQVRPFPQTPKKS